MDPIQTIALTLGVAWASGINLYAAVFMLGYLGMTGHIALPPDLAMLSDPLVLGAAGLMYCVEFFADKTPGVDTGWDVLHTFIRIPAGAILAVGALGDVSPAAQLAAALVGGSLTAATHATKAGGRMLINTSPEPVSNWTVSVTEDIAVIGGLWAALHYPWLFIGLLIVFVLLMVWLLPRIWRGLRSIAGTVTRWFRGRQSAPTSAAESSPPQLKHDKRA